MAVGWKSSSSASTRSCSWGSQPGIWMSSAGHALAKNIFDLLEDILFVAVALGVMRAWLELFLGKGFRQLLEGRALFLARLLRRDGLRDKKQIAPAAARHVGHTLAADTECRAR